MSIADNLARIRAELGAHPDGARLIAVSKTHPAEAVEEALRAGQRVFGENRVREARGKFPALRAIYPDIELHLIGPLQTNKVEDAVALFDVIQTLDRPKLADALATALQKQAGRKPRFYIEVNIGREAQKSGVAPEALPSFIAYCRTRGLAVDGLMCIPPQGEKSQAYFETLRKLAAAHNLPHLSMGMSADYKIAIACGATDVRIGTAIFGRRPA
jgi:pyridoxal phosphate enzyme (YggS family)